MHSLGSINRPGVDSDPNHLYRMSNIRIRYSTFYSQENYNDFFAREVPFQSGTSGKAGGLERFEPLKAVEELRRS